MDGNDRGNQTAAAIEHALASNRAFVEGSTARARDGRPRLGLAVVTCMDTRLTRLLPEALGLDDGDAVFVKVAGATIVEPYGEAMRSLLVAVGELGVTDIMVVGHTDCGTCGMASDHLLEALERAGVPAGEIERAMARDPQARRALGGFEHLEDEVASSVRKIREHPLMPGSLRVGGFVVDVQTGELSPVAV